VSHLLDGLFKLPASFQGKPRIAALFAAGLVQSDELEGVFAAIDTQRDVETANRRHLEILARLVKEPGRPQDDEVLRKLVIGRAFANSSNGNFETLIRVHSLLFDTQAATIVRYTPKYLQIRQPRSTYPSGSALQAMRVCKLYLAVLQACVDPGTSIDLYFVPDTSMPYPSTIGLYPMVLTVRL
jgi:hypothetical protein